MIAVISYHNLKYNITISNNALFQLKVIVHAWVKMISLVNFHLVKFYFQLKSVSSLNKL